jgi:prefoldin subunit 5
MIEDSNKLNQLEDEIKLLKEKVDKLNTTLAKFTQGSKILEMMLSSKRCVFNKKRFKLSS